MPNVGMLTSPTAAHQFLGNPVGIAPAPFSDQLVTCGYHQRLGSPLVNGTIQICWHPFIPKQKMSKVFKSKDWKSTMDLLLQKVNKSPWNICVICKSYIHPQKSSTKPTQQPPRCKPFPAPLPYPVSRQHSLGKKQRISHPNDDLVVSRPCVAEHPSW